MSDAREELESGMALLLSEAPRARTPFQMDYLIAVRLGGTVWGIYRQALRELEALWRSMRDSQMDLMDAQEVLGRANTKPRARRRAEARVADIEHGLSAQAKELAHFYAIAQRARAELGDLSAEDESVLEQDFRLHQIYQRAAGEYMSTGRVSGDTHITAMSFPPLLRAEAMAALNRPETLREALVALNEKNEHLLEPSTRVPESYEVRALLCP